MPIHTMISIVADMLAVTRSRRGATTASANSTGTLATSASSTCRESPAVPATTRPSTDSIAASRTGWARSSITVSSCTAITPRSPTPAANTQPPK